MKRALLALASVSVPLTFTKTNNHATRRWTPSSRQARFDIQTQRKEARGQHREPPERSDTRRCPQNNGGSPQGVPLSGPAYAITNGRCKTTKFFWCV